MKGGHMHWVWSEWVVGNYLVWLLLGVVLIALYGVVKEAWDRKRKK
jgi:hypothetical protein